MFKFITNFFKEDREYKKEWKEANKAAKGLTGLKRLLVYQNIPMHAGIYSTITDVIDTLEDHEKRIKKIESGV